MDRWQEIVETFADDHSVTQAAIGLFVRSAANTDHAFAWARGAHPTDIN
jgi:hypothetical protein